MSASFHRKLRDGVTLIEILVVISIVTLVVSISLPAIHMARESVRDVQCANQLRQLGLSLQTFESAHGQFPTDGWGWTWVGDTNAGHNLDGPGGWIFNVLPFVEQQTLWEMTKTDDGRFSLGTTLT